jgi:hypothetical protein
MTDLTPLLGESRVWLPWPEAEYWRQSRRPLASLAFILPALAIYEAGVLLLGPSAIRNGADVWLRDFLDLAGGGQYFLLPLLSIALLAAWHHLSQEEWRLPAPVLVGMFCECVVLGLTLVAVGRMQAALFERLHASHSLPLIVERGASAGWSSLGRFIGFLGAGVYEEILFRLTLLPLVAAAWQMVGGSRRWRTVGAMTLTSVAFSAAHYLGAEGEHFQAFSFCFRSLAGFYFAGLFVYRGLGIAAGAHACYDILVGVC